MTNEIVEERYNNSQDASMRLANTYIRVNKEACYVLSVGDKYLHVIDKPMLEKFQTENKNKTKDLGDMCLYDDNGYCFEYYPSLAGFPPAENQFQTSTEYQQAFAAWFNTAKQTSKNPVNYPSFNISYNDPRVDISHPGLGYLNTSKNDAIFLTRNPLRKQKQGLTLNYMRMFCPSGGGGMINTIDHMDVFKMMDREYPDFMQAQKTLIELDKTEKKKKANSIAFSPNLCLSKTSKSRRLFLFFRERVVGIIDPFRLSSVIFKESIGEVTEQFVMKKLAQNGYSVKTQF